MSFNDYYHNIIMLLKYVEIFPEKYCRKCRKFSGQFFRLTTLSTTKKKNMILAKAIQQTSTPHYA